MLVTDFILHGAPVIAMIAVAPSVQRKQLSSLLLRPVWRLITYQYRNLCLQHVTVVRFHRSVTQTCVPNVRNSLPPAPRSHLRMAAHGLAAD